MNGAILILSIVCGLKAASISFQVDSHGFILNWVTFTPLVSNNAGFDYKPDIRTASVYYIFAGYYSKLKEGKMQIDLRGQVNKAADKTITSELKFDKEQQGRLLFTFASLNSLCKWKEPISLDALDASVDGDKFILAFNIQCTTPSLADVTTQGLEGSLNDKVGGTAGKVLGNLAGDAAKDAMSKGASTLARVFV